MKDVTFYGHGVYFGILPNILLAILAPLTVFQLYTYQQMEIPAWGICCAVWWTLMIFPNSTYLFFELKHLLLDDGIATGNPMPAVIVFGGLSMLGFLLSVLAILLALPLMEFSGVSPYLLIVLLSLLSALGASFGLLDLVFLVGFIFPPVVLIYAYKVIRNKRIMMVVLLTATVLSAVTCSLYYFFF